MSLDPLTKSVVEGLATSITNAAKRIVSLEETNAALNMRLEAAARANAFWEQVRAQIGNGYGFECERCPACKVGPVLLTALEGKAHMSCCNCAWRLAEEP